MWSTKINGRGARDWTASASDLRQARQGRGTGTGEMETKNPSVKKNTTRWRADLLCFYLCSGLKSGQRFDRGLRPLLSSTARIGHATRLVLIVCRHGTKGKKGTTDGQIPKKIPLSTGLCVLSPERHRYARIEIPSFVPPVGCGRDDERPITSACPHTLVACRKQLYCQPTHTAAAF